MIEPEQGPILPLVPICRHGAADKVSVHKVVASVLGFGFNTIFTQNWLRLVVDLVHECEALSEHLTTSRLGQQEV